MKKIFGFRRKGREPSGFSTGLQTTCLDFGRQIQSADSLSVHKYLAGYKPTGKIYKAASKGNVAKVQQMLLCGENSLNGRDKKNRTALHYACAYGHPEVVTLLVERKCDIDTLDNEHSTALIKASQYQQEECLSILLKHGADPNVKDSRGNTALHYAVSMGNTSTAAQLLAYNAKKDEKIKAVLTQLIPAISENRHQMAESLLNIKEDLCGVDRMGRKPIPLECGGKTPENSPNSKPEKGLIVSSDEEQESLDGSENKFQLQKTQDKHTDAGECAHKRSCLLQRLTLEHPQLIDTIREQKKKMEQLQEKQFSSILNDDLNKLIEAIKSLQCNVKKQCEKKCKVKKEKTGCNNLKNMTKEKLNEQENGEFHSYEDVKTEQFKGDIEINLLKEKVDDVTEQLKYISLIKQGLDKQNQSLQQEIQHRVIHEKQLETLLLNQHKLEEELKELKNYKEQNMVYNDEIEQYKREVEDKAKEVLSQTVDKVNQVLKKRKEADENLQQSRENQIASLKDQMERKIKDLELALTTQKSQAVSLTSDIKKYKESYLKESEIRKHLSDQLNKFNKCLEEQNRSLLLERSQITILLNNF